MVFQKVEKVNWELVQQLETTERGEGGFGHTGKQ
jgi:dUTPase